MKNLVSISKDADKLLCVLYKEFLNRRKNGFTKMAARRFKAGTIPTLEPITDWQASDITDAMLELAKADLLRILLGGDCDLNDQAIIYMENWFKDGLKEVLSFLANFIP